MGDWRDLEEELARWRDGGRRATFWWRDDDAVAPGPRLDRLLGLADAAGAPLALAVVPGASGQALAAALRGHDRVSVLAHGLRHRNLAPVGEKKAEFGAHRPVHEMLGDAAIGWEALSARFGALARPVFVPPWNRVDGRLLARLPLAGLSGLSRYGARRSRQPAPGLVECNCHLDPVDWRGGRGFLGRQAALEMLLDHLRRRRLGEVDGDEPSGILSHHAVCDEAGWEFLAELLANLRDCDGAHWLTADEIFRLPA